MSRARAASVALGVLLCFLAAVAGSTVASDGRRITPAGMSRLGQASAGPGTSGLAEIRTTVLSGDPTRPGLYTIRLSVPANTRIEAHVHRDERSGVVVSGDWSIGYGEAFAASALEVLPPGSFYTEPAGRAHFARTGAAPVVLYITGYGPTDTRFPH